MNRRRGSWHARSGRPNVHAAVQIAERGTRILRFGVLIAAITIHSSDARQPKSLPEVTLDCYESFTTGIALPESHFHDIAIDGDNSNTARYRLQVVDKTTLKIIYFPDNPALRSEYGKRVSEMTEENRRPIVGWREEDSGDVKLFTINFEDRLFSILKIPAARSIAPIASLELMKCR
jgi:hypothetical protein